MNEIIKNIIAKTDWMKTFVCIAIISIYFTIVRALIYNAIPVENRESLIHVLGTMDGVVSLLVGYYFGSSKGSQDKQRTIDKITDEKINS